MAEDCVFCEIIQGEKPGDFVYQGDPENIYGASMTCRKKIGL
jgi:hypothetical protein